MRTRWLTIETVKGEPLTVGSRTLVPLAPSGTECPRLHSNLIRDYAAG